MSSIARHGDGPVPSGSPALPDSYAWRLSGDLYRHFDGDPPAFLLRELGAHMLFSHIGRFVGVRAVNFKPVEKMGGMVARCCSYMPIKMRISGQPPQVISLSEIAYLQPEDGGSRGLKPVIDIYNEHANRLLRQPRQLIQSIDRMVWGPFVPEAYDARYAEQAEDLCQVVDRPDEPNVRTKLEEFCEDQESYVRLLESIADSFDIGRPETDPVAAPDFLLPDTVTPMCYRNPNLN